MNRHNKRAISPHPMLSQKERGGMTDLLVGFCRFTSGPHMYISQLYVKVTAPSNFCVQAPIPTVPLVRLETNTEFPLVALSLPEDQTVSMMLNHEIGQAARSRTTPAKP